MTRHQNTQYGARARTTLSRRALLAIGGASAAGAAVVGCSPGSTPEPEPSAHTAVKLPSYHTSEIVVPDLPASVDLMAGWLSYPADPAQTVAEPAVTAGTKISVFGTQGAPGSGLTNNRLWHEIEQDMGGADLKFTIAPNGKEHQAKLATMLAGDDMTDIMQLAPVSGLPLALERRFSDLSEHLGGDAITDYPNLAALPTWAWKGCVYNGKLYTVPVVRGKLKNIPLLRTDIARDLGVNLNLSSGKDFRQLCRDLTDPDADQWAIGQNPARWVEVVASMMGAPNQWQVNDDGTFVHMWETDAFGLAIEQVRSMFLDDKVFHPKSAVGQNPQPGFANGSMLMQWSSYAVWAYQLRTNPEIEPGSFQLPKWEGGGDARHFVATAPFQFSGIPQADPDRVAELLRALNYWAAPCGSKEFTLRLYGVEGTDHTRVDGQPVLTDKGRAEAPSPVSTVASPPPYIYLPGEPEATQQLYDLQAEIVPSGVVDPTVGLFSETAVSLAITAQREIMDVLLGIVVGRDAVADWDAALDRWRTKAGDAMREEYQQAHAEHP